jgi:hypothetical protein
MGAAAHGMRRKTVDSDGREENSHYPSATKWTHPASSPAKVQQSAAASQVNILNNAFSVGASHSILAVLRSAIPATHK